MRNKAKNIVVVLIVGLLLISIGLTILFGWWWTIPIVLIGIILSARKVSLRYYKTMRNRSDFTTEKGRITIKMCNEKINELNGLR